MSDRTRVTVRVASPRQIAFDVFTRQIDGWWRHGKKFRVGEPSTRALEPGVGGRLTETVETARGPKVWTMDEVRLWEPPRRLVLSWRAVNFGPDDPSTEIEVNFERAIGHAGEGTLVTVEHRGFGAVRPDHPVRHGQPNEAFVRSLGLWWGDQLGSLRERVALLTS